MFFPRCPVPYPLRTRTYPPKAPEPPPLRRGSPPHEHVGHSSERMYITLSVSACKKRNKSHKPNRTTSPFPRDTKTKPPGTYFCPNRNASGTPFSRTTGHTTFRNRAYYRPLQKTPEHTTAPRIPEEAVYSILRYILRNDPPGHPVPNRQAIDSAERAVLSPNGYKKPEPRPRQPA